jgi:bifunctional non-homologous end joining protein LigD
VVEAALVTHELLEEIGIKHFCKTSGGKGLHIFIPLHGKYEYEQSRQFANIVALKVHERLPDTTSLIRNPKKREKKIYLDYLQNKLGQTIVAPYAVRPRPGAKVSTPLDWSEVNKKLDPGQFTIKTVPKRLKKKGDLFTGILGRGINLEIALKKLNKLSR